MSDESEKIAPALTAEQWTPGKGGYRRLEFDAALGLWHRDELNQCGSSFEVWTTDGSESATISDKARHAIAALALYRQSFGFTQADLATLRAEIELLGLIGDHASNYRTLTGQANAPLPAIAELQSIVDRIAALLPPADPADAS